MTFGITSFGAYLPRLRIERAAIAAANAWMAPALKSQAKGRRAFASWDEDSVTMAVEAARDCLAGQARDQVQAVWLASTTLPYADYQNSAIIAAALGLNANVAGLDLSGSQRAGVAGLAQGLASQIDGLLIVAAERPNAKPASLQELSYGAGAAALTLGSDRVVAKLLGRASRTSQFADHFRGAGSDFDYYWEDRWIREEGYAKLIPEAVGEALGAAGTVIGKIVHFVMPTPLRGAADSVAKLLGLKPAPPSSLDGECGYTGAAHGLLGLVEVLERAKPGEQILLVGFGQGVDVLVLETTAAIEDRAPSRGVTGHLADRVVTDAYMRLLSFYGAVEPDWGMRGEKGEKVSLSAHHRAAQGLAAFVGGACQACGTVQFPVLAYCVNPACAAPSAQFTDHPLADESCRVLTFTADWLSYYPAPPLHVGFVQFASGARLLMEMVDIGPSGIEIGTPLRSVFRIKERDKQRGFNRYFWKATPVAP